VFDIETSSMRSQTSIVIELKNRRYITGRISCMPLIATVSTIAQCPRTYLNIHWEGKKMFPAATRHCVPSSNTLLCS